MKTWNDPTAITVVLPQAVSHKPTTEVQFLTKVLIFNFPVNNTNSENWKDEFGWEISASGLRHHVRFVARVCLLPFPAPQITRFYQNQWTDFEKHRKSVKSKNPIEIIGIWSSAAGRQLWNQESARASSPRKQLSTSPARPAFPANSVQLPLSARSSGPVQSGIRLYPLLSHILTKGLEHTPIWMKYMN